MKIWEESDCVYVGGLGGKAAGGRSRLSLGLATTSLAP